MDDTWGYVVAGYAITAASLTAYVVWLRARARRIRRSVSDDDG